MKVLARRGLYSKYVGEAPLDMIGDDIEKITELLKEKSKEPHLIHVLQDLVPLAI